MSAIVLTTINAKWTHPSLALRLLKANLGSLETQCEIIEFALRQPLCEKTAPLLVAAPRILGVSVSIWNHIATIELLEALEKQWATRPIVVLGGPEVSYLPDDADIFKYADYVIRGEGEKAFCTLCDFFLNCNKLSTIRESLFPSQKNIFQNENKMIGAGAQSSVGDIWLNFQNGHAKACVNQCQPSGAGRALRTRTKEFIFNVQDDLAEIKTGYHLYTEEDIAQKLIYVESSRGCPFECEFCLSAVKSEERGGAVREFPLEQFLADMNTLVNRGVRTFKFLDRTFNANIKRALRICEFFLQKLEERKRAGFAPFVVHFEMVPSLFPRELCEILARFPPDSLRLEIGVQTLNPEVSARIRRPGWRNKSINPEKELETLRFLRKNTNAIIHADLIAGLPGEDLQSFGRGFDSLWQAVCEDGDAVKKREAKNSRVEIQLGILKQLPGAPISRHNETFGMRYNCKPPYEIEETSSISKVDLQRVKNFAAFWERLVNRGLLALESGLVFEKFMALSDSLLSHFGKNWGIDKDELMKRAADIWDDSGIHGFYDKITDKNL
ncbi:B12-binding domain-containing radical SAM protein [Treponema sp. R80B11-R83G3]